MNSKVKILWKMTGTARGTGRSSVVVYLTDFQGFKLICEMMRTTRFQV